MNKVELEDLMYRVGKLYLLHNPKETSADFHIVGSQSVWGLLNPPSKEMRISNELDVMPDNFTEEMEVHMYMVLGELSDYHSRENVYLDVVEEKTVKAPENWKNRTSSEKIRCDTMIMDIKFMDIHDLAISKMMRNAPKDQDFVREMFRCNVLSAPKLNKLFQNEMDEYLKDPKDPGDPTRVHLAVSAMKKYSFEELGSNKKIALSPAEANRFEP